MKRPVAILASLLGGAGLGGGAGWAAGLWLVPLLKPPSGAPAQEATALVAVPRLLAPLVEADGRLAGYNGFTLQIEVPADRAAEITDRLPVLQDAINMRAYRAPLAAGPDGLLPDLERLRRLVQAAADQALGRGVVRRVLVTEAAPA